MARRDLFKYFHSSPEIIRLAVMIYVRFPLSLRNVEDLLHERGIDISHETVRYWWDRFGPMFAAEIRRKRVQQMRSYSSWRWHLDKVFVKINGEWHYLWRAVDHEGEVLESYVTKRRDRRAALKFLRKTMKRFGPPHVIVTDLLRSVNAGLKPHQTPERKRTIWLDLAGVKVRHLVGFRFVHRPARRSAHIEQRSCAGLRSNRTRWLLFRLCSIDGCV